MKKLVASLSLTTMGAFSAFGLLGLGATSASAVTLPIPGAAHTAICAAVNTALLNNAAPLNTATNAHNLAVTNLANAVTAQAAALAAYAAGAQTVIADLDAIPVSPNLAGDTLNFKSATTAFVNSVVNAQTLNQVEETTSTALATVNMTKDVMTALGSAVGC